MPENGEDRIAVWRRRWERNPSWVKDVIAALGKEPHQQAAARILRLSWYSKKNGFQPLTFSPGRPAQILDLRGIPFRQADLENVALPLALLEGADFFKANLRNADLSFVSARRAVFHDAHLDGANLTAARLEGADLSLAHLAGADLTRAHLEGADLGWTDLKEAKLISAHLDEAILEKTSAEKADFSESSLINVNLPMAQCREANFSGARLPGARFVAAHLEGASFAGADLQGADLSLTYLEAADFSSADLKRAELARAQLDRADFSAAILIEANLSVVRLTGALLKNADLREANFQSAVLEKADLADANLTGANLADASLLEANLEGSDLRGADLIGCRLRSRGSSASVNDYTCFGYLKDSETGASKHDMKTGPLFQSLSKLDRHEREEFDPALAQHLCNQVRLLYRDNGFSRQAAMYFEEENYWLTRICLRGGQWWRYLTRRLFLELFVGYGERPGRLVVTGLVLIFLWALLFLFNGVWAGGRMIDYDMTSWVNSLQAFIPDLWICILFSLQCFTTISLGTVLPAGGLSHALASLEGLVGLFIIALGIVTFVRKAVRD